MPSSPTIPTSPLPHLAMDYAKLREEGIRHLGRLAGEQWTDFNAHDPGITILEQLCYAITELAYRTNFPIPDLIASQAGTEPPGPFELLPCDPVTLDDLRRLAVDTPGVDNAWIERAAPALDVYYHDASKQIRLKQVATDSSGSPVDVRGLLRVVVQPVDASESAEICAKVLRRLHGARPLGQDFEVTVAEIECIKLTKAEVEIDPVEDATETLADIVQSIEDLFAPPVEFARFADCVAEGQSLDQLLEGARLTRGVVTNLPQVRREAQLSDLVRAITNVPHVRVVRSLDPSRVLVAEGKLARIDPESQIALFRNGRRVVPKLGTVPEPGAASELGEALSRVAKRRKNRNTESTVTVSLDPPSGTYRSPEGYRSIMGHMPAAYGVAPLGLPEGATVQRVAQVRQLQAYLLIFDQLLANQFAQLANAAVLLSPSESEETYFIQGVNDAPFSFDQPKPASEADRRGRFLQHLLARYAEQLADGAFPGANNPENCAAFLLDYPELSRARGTGQGLLATPLASGYVKRLEHKLQGRKLEFALVERILLRPIPEDRKQDTSDPGMQIPLLDDAASPDPWSFQLSLVFKEPDPPLDEGGESLICEIIRAETPAHLVVHLHWLDNQGTGTWDDFEKAWSDFLTHLCSYRSASAADRGPTQLKLRDARDRVVELLELGKTYPLRDIPFPKYVGAAPGTKTSVPLSFSQLGVSYQLQERVDGQLSPVDSPWYPGTGSPLNIPTPTINNDVTFRILARRAADTSNIRQALLDGEVTVKEGVDPSLEVHVVGLESLGEETWLATYGASVIVEVRASQPGVEYELVDANAPERPASYKRVVGTGGAITLTSIVLVDDIDLGVRGTLPEHQSALLSKILLVRVRANSGTIVALSPPVITYGEGSRLVLSDPGVGVEYQLWARKLRDRDFVFDPNLKPRPIQITGDNGHVVLVSPPAPRESWQDEPGFERFGGPLLSDGSPLEVPLGRLQYDTMFLVQATKTHRKGALQASSDELSSCTQLRQAVALLVRPNPDQLLHLMVRVNDSTSIGQWQVTEGEPGVFYELQLNGNAIALPAYFHQKDDQNPKVNKGISQLGVETDLVVARDRKTPPTTTADRTPPLPPLLKSTRVPIGSEIALVAKRAMTQLSARLSRTAILHRVPEVEVVPPTVVAGNPAKLLLKDTSTEDRYTLRHEKTTTVLDGNGATLEFATGPLDATCNVEIRAERKNGIGLPLERIVSVTVNVVKE